MRPERYSSCAAHTQRLQAAQELQHKPPSQNNHRRYLNHKNENQREHPGAREKDHVGPHHSRDSAAGAECRDGGIQVGESVSEAGADPADKVKQQVSEMAEEVFYVVAKNPEEKHIAQQVQPTGMQEHACQQQQKGFTKGSTPL